jgi:hypothetical protein
MNEFELTKYLFHHWIFIIITSTNICDWLKQTLKHVMFFCLNHNRIRENMLFIIETQTLRRLLKINKSVKTMSKWLMKTNLFMQFSLTIECLEWFRSIMWAKQMHKKSTNKSQYFVVKSITCHLRDEKTKKDFNFSRFFFYIYCI